MSKSIMMNKPLIYGIQQIGIGVKNADTAFEWYATKLGSDISVFDDSNEATYMAQYMGGVPHKKRAILAINMQGGGGYEIWQYLDREPADSERSIELGDYGINIITVKSRDINKSFSRLKSVGVETLSEINEEPDGKKSFYIKDLYGNILRIKEFNSWFSDKGNDTGGLCGCVIGVSDINTSLKLYSDILGYNKIIYDNTGKFADLQNLPNGQGEFRRVLLSHEEERTGGFSPLFGDSQIELIQSIGSSQKKIFEGRFWGDMGYIHVCFDIKNMKQLVNECSEKGFPFKVISSESFDMGDANGHWGYIEDSDGTLIEFVETHKVPLLKKLNWYINLRKRDPHKPLPRWIIKAMSLKRVKFKRK